MLLRAGSELDNSASVLPATVFANTVNLESVARGGVIVPAADLLFQLIDFTGEKFHRPAALGADHVVMTAPVVLVLVARDAVVKRHLASQPALGEKLERPVDSGVANLGVFLLDQAVQLVGGEMLARFQKGAENRVALRGLLQPNPLQMLVKDALRFPDHLGRDGRLVIDPFLQHGRNGGHSRRPGQGLRGRSGKLFDRFRIPFAC